MSKNKSHPLLNAEAVVDFIVRELQHRITEQGLNEIELPNKSKDFSEKKMGVKWEGTVILNGGKFRGLQTIHQIGPASADESPDVERRSGDGRKEVIYSVDLGLTKPKVLCEFKLIFMSRERRGIVNGTVKDVTFNIVIAVNVITCKIRVVQFRFKEIGAIETEVSGLGLVFDYVASKVANTIINRMKEEIKVEVERKLSSVLRQIIEETAWPIPDLSVLFMAHAGYKAI